MSSLYSCDRYLLLLTCSLFVSSCFLAEAHVVTHLPGFHGPLPFHLETGYVTVNEFTGAQLFYYFIESERSPKEDPLLLWLVGGPCCSGLTALVAQIGPVRVKSSPFNASEGTLPQLISHPYSWTRISNIIFLDWPVGSGFSFSKDARDYNPDDILSTEIIYRFLLKWYESHHDFLPNPLYIAGESYGGMLAPIVVQAIADGKDAGMQPVVNIKGYIVGNPVTDEDEAYRSTVEYTLGAGIISNELFEAIRRTCVGESYLSTNNSLCKEQLHIFQLFLKEISLTNILDPSCPKDFDPWGKRLSSPQGKPLIPDTTSKVFFNLPPVPETYCTNYGTSLLYFWANNKHTREALNIKQDTVQEWVRCNADLNYNKTIKNNVAYHLNVMRRGYRALVFNGDHDALIPFLSTTKWIKSLNFPVLDKWRSWRVGGQVAGYTVMYTNDLTFATVKGGSHASTNNYPREGFSMFERWISGKTL